MQSVIKFTISFTDGTQEVQELPLQMPPEQVEGFVMKALFQYAQLGMLKKMEVENRFILVPANQIARVEVDMPKITIASSLDAQAIGQMADNLRKIVA